ncbi:hypothetical protein [Miltoncostaea oceani]|uniref:hypothetical protein n=1 Tax=Miltoncostaea oceani TaxID=2843216 RepID=UPI001C3C7E63|nr:hypothetical protein [Miltoncostaea oceani]
MSDPSTTAPCVVDEPFHRVDQLVIGDRVRSLFGPGTVTQIIPLGEYDDFDVDIALDEGGMWTGYLPGCAPSGRIEP